MFCPKTEIDAKSIVIGSTVAENIPYYIWFDEYKNTFEIIKPYLKYNQLSICICPLKYFEHMTTEVLPKNDARASNDCSSCNKKVCKTTKPSLLTS